MHGIQDSFHKTRHQRLGRWLKRGVQHREVSKQGPSGCFLEVGKEPRQVTIAKMEINSETARLVDRNICRTGLLSSVVLLVELTQTRLDLAIRFLLSLVLMSQFGSLGVPGFMRQIPQNI